MLDLQDPLRPTGKTVQYGNTTNSDELYHLCGSRIWKESLKFELDHVRSRGVIWSSRTISKHQKAFLFLPSSHIPLFSSSRVPIFHRRSLDFLYYVCVNNIYIILDVDFISFRFVMIVTVGQ